MPIAGLQGSHLIIILLLVLLLFGAPKLPQLAKSLGQSMRIFRGEMREMKQESQDAKGSRDHASTDTAQRNNDESSEHPRR